MSNPASKKSPPKKMPGAKNADSPSEVGAPEKKGPPSREEIYALARTLSALMPEVSTQGDLEESDLFLHYDITVHCGAYRQRISSTATLHDVFELGNEPDAVEAFDSLIRRVFNPLMSKFRREIVKRMEETATPRLGSGEGRAFLEG